MGKGGKGRGMGRVARTTGGWVEGEVGGEECWRVGVILSAGEVGPRAAHLSVARIEARSHRGSHLD